MARSLARQAIVQLLYEKMAGGERNPETFDMIYEGFAAAKTSEKDSADSEIFSPAADPLTKDDHAYIDAITEGVAIHEDELDQCIRKHSTGSWSFDRLPFVDLCILRLAAYEIIYVESVPDNVSVSEAVELAKRYSEERNSRYINGVLGAIVREKTQPQE